EVALDAVARGGRAGEVDRALIVARDEVPRRGVRSADQRAAAASSTTPARLGTLCVPAASVPMKFPWTRAPLAPFEMRIPAAPKLVPFPEMTLPVIATLGAPNTWIPFEIGRASCRERG